MSRSQRAMEKGRIMPDTGDHRMLVQTEDGTITVVIPRSALSKLSGRSHIAPEEIAIAYRMEIEDIVRDKLLGASRTGVMRLTDADF